MLYRSLVILHGQDAASLDPGSTWRVFVIFDIEMTNIASNRLPFKIPFAK